MRGMPPLSRRALLVGLAVTATGRRAHAQPKVFLDYDQDALDRAYDQRAWAPKPASSFGGDPGRIYVAGHSSGGHLAGTVLVTDWSTDFGLPRDVVKGGVCISGMYDLRGPRLSARSSYVKFDDRIEHDHSAQ